MSWAENNINQKQQGFSNSVGMDVFCSFETMLQNGVTDYVHRLLEWSVTVYRLYPTNRKTTNYVHV